MFSGSVRFFSNKKLPKIKKQYLIFKDQILIMKQKLKLGICVCHLWKQLLHHKCLVTGNLSVTTLLLSPKLTTKNLRLLYLIIHSLSSRLKKLWEPTMKISDNRLLKINKWVYPASKTQMHKLNQRKIFHYQLQWPVFMIQTRYASFKMPRQNGLRSTLQTPHSDLVIYLRSWSTILTQSCKTLSFLLLVLQLTLQQ